MAAAPEIFLLPRRRAMKAVALPFALLPAAALAFCTQPLSSSVARATDEESGWVQKARAAAGRRANGRATAFMARLRGRRKISGAAAILDRGSGAGAGHGGPCGEGFVDYR